MLKKFPIIIVIAILIMDVLPSCYDEDFLDISDSINWHPSFSLPIGSTAFKIDNVTSLIDATLPDWLDTVPDYMLDSLISLLDSVPVEFNDSLIYVHQKINLKDSFEYNFSDIIDNDYNINNMLFRINIESGFPTKSNMQIYLADSTNNFIDSLFSNSSSNSFPPASTDENSKVIESSVNVVDIRFDSTRIDKLKLVKKVLFNVNVFVTNEDIKTVKFYSSYNLFVKLGIRLNFQKNISVSGSDK